VVGIPKTAHNKQRVSTTSKSGWGGGGAGEEREARSRHGAAKHRRRHHERPGPTQPTFRTLLTLPSGVVPLPCPSPSLPPSTVAALESTLAPRRRGGRARVSGHHARGGHTRLLAVRRPPNPHAGARRKASADGMKVATTSSRSRSVASAGRLPPPRADVVRSVVRVILPAASFATASNERIGLPAWLPPACVRGPHV
jgi:hypothetical protein